MNASGFGTPEQRGPGGLARGAVLVVEDEDYLRRATAAMVARLGYDPLAAADGAEARRLFDAHHPDIQLAILDLSLPDCTGEALYTAFRARCPHLPILIASGSPPEELGEAEGFDLARQYLKKPYRLDALQKKIEGLRTGG